MFSGGDSSDGVNSFNHLGAFGFVNQVAVSNAMAAGQTIDWAQLAQQWIQMRDNSELDAKVGSNTSTSKVTDTSCNNPKFEEKGEADMDMDDEEQSDDKTTQRTNNDFNTTSVHNSNQPWFMGETSYPMDRRLTSSNQWNLWPNRENLIQPLPNQNATNNGPTNPTAHIPSLLKMTVPHPNEIRVMPDVHNPPDSSNMIDAAKRKGLPAWIREGLEKMEREKQRQLEKEQKSKDINNEDISNKNTFVSSINSAPAAILDEESSDNEESLNNIPNVQDGINLKKDDEKDSAYRIQAEKTYEQKIADLMIAVRRILTELLLEATNEEISKVADETIKIFKSKASSAQVIRKSALSTLTGKLGLAAYGDSSSENDSDNDNEERNTAKKTKGQSDSDNDTEEEILNIIRLKRRAFIKTSEEIEEHTAVAAAREEEKLKYFLRKEEEQEKEQNRRKQDWPSVRDPSSSGHSGHSIFKGYEKDFGEITETKIQHPNGKRQKERNQRRERTTRFSDNKEKYVTLTNAASFLPNINSATNFCIGKNNSALAANSQRQQIPDLNGLLPNYSNAGMKNVLNAADAALEKALKGKASASPEKKTRRHEYDRSCNQSKKRQRLSERKNSRSYSKSSSSSTSSSSSSTSSDSDSSSSSTSQSSHHTKTKHRSGKRHKQPHAAADKKHRKSSKDRKGDRKHSSYLYEKRDRESTTSRNLRNVSSDSEDEYRRRHRSSTHNSYRSAKTHSYSSRRSRDRENSRSKSRSYSSTNRRQ